MADYKYINFILNTAKDNWYYVMLNDTVDIPTEVTKPFLEGLLFEDEIVNGGIDEFVPSFNRLAYYIKVDKSKVTKLNYEDIPKSRTLIDVYGNTFYASFFTCKSDDGEDCISIELELALSKFVKCNFGDLFMKYMALCLGLIPKEIYYNKGKVMVIYSSRDIDEYKGNIYFSIQSILLSIENRIMRLSLNNMERQFNSIYLQESGDDNID